jgi:hypothetical protein
MNIPELVDELYEAFAEGLGEPQSLHARELPRLLGLAPIPGVRWSRVFAHEVTLGAPALFAEAMGVPSDLVRDAVLAHLLAVIDAFGNDRIEDDQVPASPELLAVLGRMRKERDRAIVRLFGGPPLPEVDYALADALSLRAIRRERALLLAARPVDVDTYERASRDKQCLGIVASMALGRMAGWDDRRCHAVRLTLESVWLGLQMYDDVVDWEDDVQRGGSWAVSLMKGARRVTSRCERETEGTRIRLHVLQSGILHVMLRRAVFHMRAARRRAASLGAERLAAWAAGCEHRFEGLADAEQTCAGYTVRAHVLAAWAGEVLA